MDVSNRGDATIQTIADHYGIDKKTAIRYHALWKHDKALGLDYSREDDVKRSALRPMVRRAWDKVMSNGRMVNAARIRDAVPNHVARFGDQGWKDLSKLISSLQTSAVSYMSADDLVYFINKGADEEGAILARVPKETRAMFAKANGLLRGATLTAADVQRARKEHELTYKKVAYDYIEKDLRYVKEKSNDLLELQKTLFAEDCVFIDEFSVTMNMAPSRAWAKKGEIPQLRRREQSDTRTIVWAAMKWPDDEKKTPAFFLRIFPPLPSRIVNHTPCLNQRHEAVAETLRQGIWWDGIVQIVGDICRQEEGAEDRIRLFKLKQVLGDMSKDGTFFYDWFVKKFPYDETRGFANCAQMPDKFWTRLPPDADGQHGYRDIQRAINCTFMRENYWLALPDKLIAEHVTFTDDNEERVEFVLRLAAYDYVSQAYISQHNYRVSNRVYGEEPPVLSGWMHKGRSDITITGMLERTKSAAQGSVALAYDDTRGRYDHEEDFEDGIQATMTLVYNTFKTSSFETIYLSLFYPLSQPHRDRRSKLHTALANPISPLYSKWYADLHNSKKVADMDLAKAVFHSMNLSLQRYTKKQNLSRVEMAVHIWKIVHVFRGEKDAFFTRIHERLPSLVEGGGGYKYRARANPDGPPAPPAPPAADGDEVDEDAEEEAEGNEEEDKYFNGDMFPTKFETHINNLLPARAPAKIRQPKASADGVRHREISTINLRVSQMRELNVGAAPVTVSKSLFRSFIRSLPDSFVKGKTVLLDGASYHDPASNRDIALNNKLPPQLAVFPISELSPLAQLLRKRGGGDGVLEPPTRLSMREDGRRPALIFTPPYSPEYNPIEQAFNTGKHYIRKEAFQHTRTRLNLSIAVINAFHALIRPHAIKNYMLCSGYRSIQKDVVPRKIDPQPAPVTDTGAPVRKLKCMGRFVDGKYTEDDGEVQPRKGRALELGLRDHVCPGSMEGDEQYKTRSVNIRKSDPSAPLPAREPPPKTRCRVPRPSDCQGWMGKTVDFVHKGEQKRGVIVKVPQPNSNVRVDWQAGRVNDPWFHVKVDGVVKPLPVMIKHITPPEDIQKAAAEVREEAILKVDVEKAGRAIGRAEEYTAQILRDRAIQQDMDVDHLLGREDKHVVHDVLMRHKRVVKDKLDSVLHDTYTVKEYGKRAGRLLNTSYRPPVLPSIYIEYV